MTLDQRCLTSVLRATVLQSLTNQTYLSKLSKIFEKKACSKHFPISYILHFIGFGLFAKVILVYINYTNKILMLLLPQC